VTGALLELLSQLKILILSNFSVNYLKDTCGNVGQNLNHESTNVKFSKHPNFCFSSSSKNMAQGVFFSTKKAVSKASLH
jgi:hypothetical protein